MDVIPVDTTVEATITGVAPFGAFAKFAVEKDSVKHEVEGLVHISEIAWEKVDDPNQYLKTGDTIKVKVVGVDEKDRESDVIGETIASGSVGTCPGYV